MADKKTLGAMLSELKARVAALEKLLITGEKDAPPVDADDRAGRIAAIIWEELRKDKGVVISGNGDFAMMKGIRLALNEFYTGPYVPVDERIKTMQAHIDKVEHDLRVALQEKIASQKRYNILSHRIAIINVALNTEDPEAELRAMQSN
jgi:hypothetical protein